MLVAAIDLATEICRREVAALLVDLSRTRFLSSSLRLTSRLLAFMRALLTSFLRSRSFLKRDAVPDAWDERME